MPEALPPVVVAPPAAKPAAPAVDMSPEALVARAAEKLAPKPEPVAATPKINMDPATLKQLTKLSRERREFEQKVKALDTDDTKLGLEAVKLFRAGKRVEAAALLSGKTPEETMLDLVTEGVAAAPGEVPVTEQIAALAKRLDDEKAERQKEADAKAASAKAEAEKASIEHAATFIDPKFVRCARKENRIEAAEAATAAVVAMAADRELDLSVSTVEDIKALYAEAYAAIEEQYKAIAARYSDEAPAAGTPAASAGAAERVTPPGKFLSFEEILARAEERARTAQ
jgi:hypothetical protein